MGRDAAVLNEAQHARGATACFIMLSPDLYRGPTYHARRRGSVVVRRLSANRRRHRQGDEVQGTDSRWSDYYLPIPEKWHPRSHQTHRWQIEFWICKLQLADVSGEENCNCLWSDNSTLCTPFSKLVFIAETLNVESHSIFLNCQKRKEKLNPEFASYNSQT